MKKNLTQFFTVFTLILITFVASRTAARNPAVPPPSPAPTSNTPLPIDVGNTKNQYVKDGSLGVGVFEALANSQFDSKVFFKGLLLGKAADPTTPEDLSTLSVGGTNSGPVNLKTAGALAAQNVGTAGLYSDLIKTGTPGLLKPLCAAKNGDIVFCPTPPPVPPAPPAAVIKEHLAVAYNVSAVQHLTSTYPNSSNPPQYPAGTANDIISLDTLKVLVNTLPGFSTTPLAHHSANNKGILNNSEHIWTVPENGTYQVSYSASGYYSTYVKRRSKHHMEVSFFLNLNGKLIPLAPPKSGGCFPSWYTYNGYVENTQYILDYPSCPPNFGGFADGDYGHRKHTQDLRYNIAFNQTMTLKAGDQISLYAAAFGYGVDRNDVGDLYFNFITNSSVLDVIEQ